MGTIHMSGTGSIRARPDVATFRVIVRTEAPTAAETRRLNNEAARQIIAKVQQQGVEARNIQTTACYLSKIPPSRKQGAQRAQAVFSAENALSITLRNVEAVTEVLDALNDAGVASISGPHFAVENAAALRDKAREAAFERARSKAELYCRLADMRIVAILKLQEGFSGWRDEDRSFEPRREFELDDDADNAALPVAAGEKELSVTIDCQFEVAPASK